TKSILGLSNQVNSNRLRVILNKPLDRHNLWVLMRKNLQKYRNHFKEDAWIYNKINCKYECWLKSLTGNRLPRALLLEKQGYGKFKKFIGDASVLALAQKDGLKIGSRYRELHKKSYFMAWDKRDGHLIRYLVNHGFYKARFLPECKFCGE